MSIVRVLPSPLVQPIAAPLREGSGLPWGDQGGGGAPFLALTSGGTFTRASEGSYYLGAPTDGTAAFLAWAANDTRRIEDRGDGLGQMLLLEGARTNLITQSADLSNAFWAFSGLTRTGSQPSPEGNANAWRLQLISGGFFGENTGTTSAATPIAVSAWLRATSGSQTPNTNLFRATDGRIAVATALATAYQRIAIVGALSASQAHALVVTDGRDQSAVGGVVAGARDVIAAACQREDGAAFPSSYIRSSGTSVTRATDALSFAAGQYNDRLRSKGFTVVLAPDFSSADQVAGAPDAYVLSVGATGANSVRIERNAGTPRVALYNGGVLKNSVACTWSRGQRLTIAIDLTTGGITLAGFTTGNGGSTTTACSWPAASTLYIGGASDGTLPYFGRFAPTIAVKP